MNYSDELDEVVRGSLDDLIDLYNKKYFPFNDRFNEKYFQEYKKLVSNNQNKKKSEKK